MSKLPTSILSYHIIFYVDSGIIFTIYRDFVSLFLIIIILKCHNTVQLFNTNLNIFFLPLILLLLKLL